MEANTIRFESISKNGQSWIFKLSTEGFIGKFRIQFEDKTRKNSPYKNLQAYYCYFEGFTEDSFNCVSVEDATDAMLFVERKMQFILEELLRKENKINTE